MTETKSVKTLKKQLGAAIAMVLVAAVALGSSTYAWFVSNNNVTANTSSISAQSNAPFLVINAGSAVTTSTTSTDATATPNQDKALFPVQMVKAEDNASAFQWESAYAEASTSADEKDKTRFIVQTADLNRSPSSRQLKKYKFSCQQKFICWQFLCSLQINFVFFHWC